MKDPVRELLGKKFPYLPEDFQINHTEVDFGTSRGKVLRAEVSYRDGGDWIYLSIEMPVSSEQLEPERWEPGKICTANMITSNMSMACEWCGHNSVCHPGPSNVDACVLCEVANVYMQCNRIIETAKSFGLQGSEKER